MAFSILDPISTNLSNQTTPSNNIALNYGLNTESTWIYCNYPEKTQNNSFGDSNLGNKYLNQATVTSGTHQIFYSYQDGNNCGPFNFGIQIYNPNSTTLIFQELYYSHRDSKSSGSWSGVNGGMWQDFYNSSPKSSVSIKAGGVHWISTNSIPRGAIFAGNVRFKVNKNAIITVYIYKNKSNINGYATAYPKGYGDKQYSGTGKGYFFTSSTITLKASQLTSGQYFRCTHNSISSLKINGNRTNTDLIPLKLVQNGITVDEDDNIGNWCAQYFFPLKLYNDTSKKKTFSGYVKTENKGSDNWLVIQSGSQCKYATLNSGSKNSWKWFSKTLNPGETYSDSFQFMLGTNSCRNVSHIFRVS